MSSPIFCVVGHVNKGKSSVVSTLTEDECKKCKDSIQNLTKKYEGSVNDALASKTTEVQET